MTNLEERKSELCLKCLECCKIVAVPYGGPPFMGLSSPYRNRYIEFYTTRGCSFVNDPEYGQFIVIPFPCPKLTPKGCSIYKDRPLICRQYDGLKSPISRYFCKWKELENEDLSTTNDGEGKE